MARFVDKPPREPDDIDKKAVSIRSASGNRVAVPRANTGTPGGRGTNRPIPNASKIYGVSAAVMALIGLYLMFGLANWLSGLLILVLAATLLGYAQYFMRYR